MKMMKRSFNIYRWFLTAWTILWGSTMSFAVTYPQTTQSASWGRTTANRSTPVYTTSSHTISSYGSSGSGVASYSTGSSNNRSSGLTVGGGSPTYHFQSTSVYPLKTTKTTFVPLADGTNPSQNGIRRGGNPWDEDPGDEDDPIGVVPDPTPVGSPLVLLALALVYIVYKKKRNWTFFC